MPLPIASVLGFAGRYWKLIALGLLVLALAVQTWRLGRAQDRVEECRAAAAQFRADVAAKTELARIRDAENKARVEREQEKVRAENDVEIRRRIDAAVAAVRVRLNAQANSGGRRAADLPRPAEAAADPAGAGAGAILDVSDGVICSENSVKAQGWQEWWEAVEAIDRGNDPPPG